MSLKLYLIVSTYTSDHTQLGIFNEFFKKYKDYLGSSIFDTRFGLADLYSNFDCGFEPKITLRNLTYLNLK